MSPWGRRELGACRRRGGTTPVGGVLWPAGGRGRWRGRAGAGRGAGPARCRPAGHVALRHRSHIYRGAGARCPQSVLVAAALHGTGEPGVGESRGELQGWQPGGPGGGSRQPRRASRVSPCGIPGVGPRWGAPGQRDPRAWGYWGFGGSQDTPPALAELEFPRCRSGDRATRLLGASPAPRRRQPRGIAILGVPQTLGASSPGLCRLRAAPSPTPGLFPSSRYRRPRVIVIARVTSPRAIPDHGVSPSPGYPKLRVTPDSGGAFLGSLFPLFPEYFRSPALPIPGCFHSPRGIPIPRAPPSRSPRVLRGSPRSCAPSRWLGWGRAGRRQNGWELPGILHDPCHEAYTTCPGRWGRASSPVGVPAARGRGYVRFRAVAPAVRDSVPVRSQPPPP